MQKHVLILFAQFLLLSLSIAQTGDEKRDNIWLFGYTDSFPPPPGFGGANLDFNYSPPTIYATGRYLSFYITNASICDTEGNLLFYTNGISVGKGINQTMINGGGLNPGVWTDSFKDFGMPLAQGALILPVPEKDSLYFIIHGSLDVTDELGPHTPKLYYSLVDMSKFNGAGAVVEKNVEVISDTLTHGKITAVRHGNGRDWWILVAKKDSNIYYRILLTPAGLQTPQIQILEVPVENGLGQAVFSPDGKKYVRNDLVGNFGIDDVLSIYDFDRCTGLLSNEIHFAYADSAQSCGVAFSPNSRFLYASHFDHIFQFDMEAPDIHASMETVATYDTFLAPYSTRFFLAALAPDGKIYLSTPGGVNILHVINKPDLKGDSCEMGQHDVQLPVYNAASMPNFPNFRLGKWEGSPCDTITVSTASVDFPFSKVFVYPNPASDFLIVESDEANYHFVLFDATGRQLAQYEVENGAGEKRIDLSDFSPGIYFFKIESEGRQVKSGKLLIVKP